MTVAEAVDYAIQNELQAGNDPLNMSEDMACVYADQYDIAYDIFFAELTKHGWER